MDFRVFYVVAIEVEKRRSGKNGKNGRKWSKMGCRGYLVGNGFPRVLRPPTTYEPNNISVTYRFVNTNTIETNA